MNFPTRLRQLRKDRKVTQLELAKQVGVDNSTISKWETGVFEPDASSIVKLAYYFQVSTDFLLGLYTEPQSILIQEDLELYKTSLIEQVDALIQDPVIIESQLAHQQVKQELFDIFQAIVVNNQQLSSHALKILLVHLHAVKKELC
ncbi:helix-turn-helix transcriptional regulator [Hazenella sp. IB182353]|uniref:helix-turn-helix domain-containing protein n=1 Tax=Polycladospora coralii TaxID=2771432 RepID=UPI0017469C68|nr:helix-turn-helix domain-containing protein [Polycladospora coralii]MBS7530037.1 helix-turn-helix transcriptional regulator [Polycladospora coralii]